MALVSSDNNYEIGAASIVFPTSVSSDRLGEVLDAALTKGVSGTNGKLISKNSITRGSLPAVEGRFQASDGYRAHLLVVASGSTLIVLMVHSRTGTERLYKALEASLIIR